MIIPIKCAVLLVASFAHHVTARPPNPPPTKEDTIIKRTYFDQIARSSGTISTIYVVGGFMIEFAVLLSLNNEIWPSVEFVSAFCPRGPPPISSISRVSPMLLLAVGFMVASALIRLSCYKALGSLFTFEITIRPNHKLITSGPYSYMRHPAYAAIFLNIIGSNLASFGAHSYISECQIMSTPAGWIVRLWFAFTAYTIVSLLKRVKTEDEELRNVFGQIWVNYSRTVPFRFIPSIA